MTRYLIHSSFKTKKHLLSHSKGVIRKVENPPFCVAFQRNPRCQSTLVKIHPSEVEILAFRWQTVKHSASYDNYFRVIRCFCRPWWHHWSLKEDWIEHMGFLWSRLWQPFEETKNAHRLCAATKTTRPQKGLATAVDSIKLLSRIEGNADVFDKLEEIKKK